MADETTDVETTEDAPTEEPSDKPIQLPDDHPILTTMRKERDRAKELERKLAEFEKAQMSEQERAIAEARDQAFTEARTEFARERLTDRVRVAAARQLNDPEDAVRLLDTTDLDPTSNNLDAEIASRLTALVEAKPYLKVSETRPSGSQDATSRPDAGGNHVSVGAAIKALRGT